ncbi:MAG TPA: hypothetical protein VJH95_05455 [Candidatus Nanoarchaeia archaeon]|nr:hypothetical protein [Candidatus Nanoarchaeia archaeon]
MVYFIRLTGELPEDVISRLESLGTPPLDISLFLQEIPARENPYFLGRGADGDLYFLSRIDYFPEDGIFSSRLPPEVRIKVKEAAHNHLPEPLRSQYSGLLAKMNKDKK